jgi:hypothetical protein
VDEFPALGFDTRDRCQRRDVMRAGAGKKPWIAWFGWGGHRSLPKKEAKKPLFTMAVERPNCGRSTAVVSKSFFGYFSSKKVTSYFLCFY